MKELIHFLASSLVDDPSSVKVEEKTSADSTVYSLSVKREDLGKVIGKKGRTAKAMRTLLSAAGLRQNKRLTLEILEPPVEETPAAMPSEEEAPAKQTEEPDTEPSKSES